MKVNTSELSGVLILETTLHIDNRGWFTESYNQDSFSNSEINVHFIQDNHSLTYHTNSIRGLHFQNSPKAQTKLVRCTRGKIMDFVVDLRLGSPTYKQHIRIELSEENKLQVYIPKGFAHGFITLTDNVEVQYKVDEYYSKEHDRSIRFDDPELNIDWGVTNPILSDKDRNAPFLKDSDVNFVYGENS